MEQKRKYNFKDSRLKQHDEFWCCLPANSKVGGKVYAKPVMLSFSGAEDELYLITPVDLRGMCKRGYKWGDTGEVITQESLIKEGYFNWRIVTYTGDGEDANLEACALDDKPNGFMYIRTKGAKTGSRMLKTEFKRLIDNRTWVEELKGVPDKETISLYDLRNLTDIGKKKQQAVAEGERKAQFDAPWENPDKYTHLCKLKSGIKFETCVLPSLCYVWCVTDVSKEITNEYLQKYGSLLSELKQKIKGFDKFCIPRPLFMRLDDFATYGDNDLGLSTDAKTVKDFINCLYEYTVRTTIVAKGVKGEYYALGYARGDGVIHTNSLFEGINAQTQLPSGKVISYAEGRHHWDDYMRELEYMDWTETPYKSDVVATYKIGAEEIEYAEKSLAEGSTRYGTKDALLKTKEKEVYAIADEHVKKYTNYRYKLLLFRGDFLKAYMDFKSKQVTGSKVQKQEVQ